MEGEHARPADGSQQPPDSNLQNGQTTVSTSLQAIKSNSAKFATFLRTKTGVAADAVVQGSSKLGQKTWTETPAIANRSLQQFRTTAADTLAKAAEGTQWIYQASVKTAVKTAEELRKMSWFGEPLQTLCKSEARTHPVPRVVAACCYTLAAGGLEAEGIFKAEADAAAVDFCAAQIGQGMVLFPPGTSSHTVAGLLKKFIASLPEPLLTFRLLPHWLSAVDDVDLIRTLLQQLPVANRNALALLMATCHRISQAAAINEMDAQALAEALAPLLLWRQAPRVDNAISSQTSSTPPPSGLPPSITAAFPDGSATDMDRLPPPSPSKAPPSSAPQPPPQKVLLEAFELQSAERLVETMISNSLSLF